MSAARQVSVLRPCPPQIGRFFSDLLVCRCPLLSVGFPLRSNAPKVAPAGFFCFAPSLRFGGAYFWLTRVAGGFPWRGHPPSPPATGALLVAQLPPLSQTFALSLRTSETKQLRPHFGSARADFETGCRLRSQPEPNLS